MYLKKCYIYIYIYIYTHTSTFKQNIFSVQAATINGAYISFKPNNCQLIHPNGAVFNITQRGHLYYLKNIISARNATYDLHTWHKILGHCNKTDIKRLPNLIKGMKIKPTPNYALNDDICIQGKMSNDRNMTLARKATKILALVHSDLAGPIQPLVKDGYKYIINFIDDYSGLTMLYFLKHKSDTLLATMKYLAAITPYGHVKCLRTDNGTEFTSEPFQWLLILNRIKHSQLLILHIKMEPLYVCGKLYFL